KRDAKLDGKLLEKLDFEAKKPGFEKLAKDKRALATLSNGVKITVADLAAVLRTNFFHGVEEAVRLQKVNSFRYGTFNKMLYRAIYDLEADNQRIADSDEYKRAVADYKEAIVFDQFVRRAVMTDVKVSEDEGKAYYQKHQAEYSFPAFYTLDALSFQSSRAAESALVRVRAGTDFKWLKANADGQVPDEKRNLDLGTGTVSAKALPLGLESQLQNARPGDLRLFSQDGQHHVVLVRATTPSKVQPYLDVRAEIAKTLTTQKLNQALQDWIARLRKAHDVKVYLSQIES
ncbi:MAG TPA: peptidylprolyl isomerase, partial [Myxococcales bacterium]|nr:peptidylprolyl isomerase [Myxococcales bacterium]